jgi:hypothetical protein
MLSQLMSYSYCLHGHRRSLRTWAHTFRAGVERPLRPRLTLPTPTRTMLASCLADTSPSALKIRVSLLYRLVCTQGHSRHHDDSTNRSSFTVYGNSRPPRGYEGNAADQDIFAVPNLGRIWGAFYHGQRGAPAPLYSSSRY